MSRFYVSKSKYERNTSTVTLRLPDEILRALDEISQKIEMSRNELITRCIDFSVEEMLTDEINWGREKKW